MVWNVGSVMDERIKFIGVVLEGLMPFSVACEASGISRKTGYKWLARYREFGVQGLEERSRVPSRSPQAVCDELASRIVAFKRAHSDLGPKKIVALLAVESPELSWPSASTAGEVLKRAGLVTTRVKRRHATPSGGAALVCGTPNELWCADFKGWFLTGDGQCCIPLTIADGHTRFFLRCQILTGRTGFEQVQPLFEACFREYGLPERLRTDNGPPFATVGLGGLSRLSVWWMRLGIRVERIKPGHPEQNGRLERLHRTLKEQAASPPEANVRRQQQAFDRFRAYYNHQRPHEALGQQPPAVQYTRSQTPFPRRLPPMPDYPAGWTVRKVKDSGRIKWNGFEVHLAQALTGEHIGLEPVQDALWRVYFMNTAIALFDEKRMKMKALPKEPVLPKIEPC